MNICTHAWSNLCRAEVERVLVHGGAGLSMSKAQPAAKTHRSHASAIAGCPLMTGPCIASGADAAYVARAGNTSAAHRALYMLLYSADQP